MFSVTTDFSTAVPLSHSTSVSIPSDTSPEIEPTQTSTASRYLVDPEVEPSAAFPELERLKTIIGLADKSHDDGASVTISKVDSSETTTESGHFDNEALETVTELITSVLDTSTPTASSDKHQMRQMSLL